MAFFVYALCALTSLICGGMLLRQHRRKPGSLIFHSAVAFLCFAVGNILLFVDLIVVRHLDLMTWRNLITLVGVLVLLVALINTKAQDGP